MPTIFQRFPPPLTVAACESLCSPHADGNTDGNSSGLQNHEIMIMVFDRIRSLEDERNCRCFSARLTTVKVGNSR